MTLVFGPARPTPPGEVEGWWKQDGLCVEVGGDEWFPETKGESRQDAIRMCLRCPVLFECRQYATDNHEVYGVWGGLGVGELRSIVRGSGGSMRGR